MRKYFCTSLNATQWRWGYLGKHEQRACHVGLFMFGLEQVPGDGLVRPWASFITITLFATVVTVIVQME